jgi:hypothetical protein
MELRGPMTEQKLEALSARNKARSTKAYKQMLKSNKHVFCAKVSKVSAPTPVLNVISYWRAS